MKVTPSHPERNNILHLKNVFAWRLKADDRIVKGLDHTEMMKNNSKFWHYLIYIDINKPYLTKHIALSNFGKERGKNSFRST